MSFLPKSWRPNRSNPDLEIRERELRGRIAENRERYQAELAERDAIIADQVEHLAILNGLLAQRREQHAQLAEAKKILAVQALELAAAKAQAHQEAVAMCMAAGIEISPTYNCK